MTIKDFAKLCGCNPQTLRYYDRQDLLKPVKVDDWTGYRYYDEEQAIAFVKIKNMQKAGFSIDEIKELLDKDDAAIYIAFERKIAEQERQLQEIKNIQDELGRHLVLRRIECRIHGCLRHRILLTGGGTHDRDRTQKGEFDKVTHNIK